MDFSLTDFILNLGNFTLDVILFPLIMWTLTGLILLAVLKIFRDKHPVYQYHGRIALLGSLPPGIVGSYLWGSVLFKSSGNTEAISKFIVIQNPISLNSASAPAQTGLYDPFFWAGILTIFAGLGAIIFLFRIAKDYFSLYRFSKTLSYVNPRNLSSLSPKNKAFLKEQHALKIAFSPLIEVPFTFGWMKQIIVMPDFLSDQPDKFNMALSHELSHIQHKDYLKNIFLMIINAVFWFHPLVIRLYNDFKKYRETVCDIRVLEDLNISRKQYASLLLELAPKQVLPFRPSVSMSIDSSTLKKRIQIMNTSNPQNRYALKNSFYLMFVCAFLIVGIMACSDIQDNGITNTDIENAQVQMKADLPENQPLYVIDGEIMSDSSDVLARLKPKYIEAIEVYKGEEARNKYGEKGKHGVIAIEVINKEKALLDLRKSAPSSASGSGSKGDFFKVAEEMPKSKTSIQELYNCIEYPSEAQRSGIEGRVVVSFIVNKAGDVEHAEVLEGIGGGADKEALRCIKQMKYEPGIHKGEKVRVQLSQPVIFRLSESE